eukprot:c16603_g1_i1 orf=70-411(-)
MMGWRNSYSLKSTTGINRLQSQLRRKVEGTFLLTLHMELQKCLWDQRRMRLQAMIEATKSKLLGHQQSAESVLSRSLVPLFRTLDVEKILFKLPLLEQDLEVLNYSQRILALR